MELKVTFKPVHVIVDGIIEYRDKNGEIVLSEPKTFEYTKDKYGNLVSLEDNKIVKEEKSVFTPIFINTRGLS